MATSVIAARWALALLATTALAACNGGGDDDASNVIAEFLDAPTGEALDTTNVNMTAAQAGTTDEPQVASSRTTVELLDNDAVRIRGPGGFDETFREDDQVFIPGFDPRLGVFQNDNGKYAIILDPTSGTPTYEYTVLGGWIDGTFDQLDTTDATTLANTLPDSTDVTQAGSVVLGHAFTGSLPTSGGAFYTGDAGGLANAGGTIYLLSGTGTATVDFEDPSNQVSLNLGLGSLAIDDLTTGPTLVLQSSNGTISNGQFVGSWDPTASSWDGTAGVGGAVAGSFFGNTDSFDTGVEDSEIGAAWNASGSGVSAAGAYVGKQGPAP